MSYSDDQFARWAQAPSETEETKCQYTIKLIIEAINDHFGSPVSLFLQGSYRNRTNVKNESDVDVVVLHTGYYFSDVHGLSEEEKQKYWAGFRGSDYTFQQYKNELITVLQQKFGHASIERKNKCIRVHKNEYRVNADVIACFEHWRFRALGDVEAVGIELIAEDKSHVASFPKQHTANAEDKNTLTDGDYKSQVRILKNIRNSMMDQCIILPDSMSSFFLECLVWNLPSEIFTHQTHKETTKAVISKIWNDMREQEKAITYAEVCDLYWLFKGQKRTPAEVEEFMLKSWQCIQ